ncbi:MAG: YceI family protein [Candidatus Binataceae bacterium]
MPRQIGRGLPALLAVLIIQGVARAASASVHEKLAVLTFEPAKTTISYKLVGWPHVSSGTFKLKTGMIRVDPATGEMAGLIVVDAASGSSGHRIRDARMKRDILEVQRFPDITFAPQKVGSSGHPPGAFPVLVRGILTLHGRPHSVTITATVERQGKLVTIRCGFTIPYVAWGLEDPSILFFAVAKVVTVRISAVANLSWRSS